MRTRRPGSAEPRVNAAHAFSADLNSLVRVSRQVLRVPKAVASQTGIIVYCLSKDSACQQLDSHGYGTRCVTP
ncbi:hypothetical protein M0804_015566 [Polistes exclamans]|nr:hypothetical protein M0804_015566 [Polistes exclamans]